MEWTPTRTQLCPPLDARHEVALLARVLWDEGYDDRISGHITYKQPDGTFLCNPGLVTWAELRPDQVIRIDGDGNVVEGEWDPPRGIPLHLELHKRRADVGVAVHSHPQWGTVWAGLGRVPPCYDQSSALGGGEVVLVDEYDKPVSDVSSARAAAQAMGGADIAVLANHGVFVTAGTIRAAHQRAVAFELRCRSAWRVEAVGAGRPLPDGVRQRFRSRDGNETIGYWEAAVREQLRRDPSLLDVMTLPGPAHPGRAT